LKYPLQQSCRCLHNLKGTHDRWNQFLCCFYWGLVFRESTKKSIRSYPEMHCFDLLYHS
jgi:hypothetical protein